MDQFRGAAMIKCPAVYDYLGYRVFLNDLFLYKKENSKNFSYRYFSQKAGFVSPNFLKLVIDDQRNLTNTSIAKMAKGFGLKKQEREFFENLVFMNQAASHEEKNHYYKKMMAMRGYNKIHKIEKENFEYFSKWYYPVIREIVMFGDRRHTPGQVASLLNPKITVKEAEKALSLLLNLGLIKRDSDGCWQQNDKAVSPGRGVKSLIITNFHKEMLKLATEAIDRHPAAERDISALTLSINNGTVMAIKEKLALFRKELLEFACNDEDSDQVIQVNLQLFPLTKSHIGEEPS